MKWNSHGETKKESLLKFLGVNRVSNSGQCKEWKRLFQGVREMISLKTFNSHREYISVVTRNVLLVTVLLPSF